MFEQSCYAGTEIVPEEATLGDGKKHVLHFRPMSVAIREAYGQQMGSDDEKIVGFAKARLLAKLLCKPDGSDAVDYLDLSKLKTEVFDSVFDACMRSLAKRKKKAGEAGKPSGPGASAGSGSRSRSR